MLTSVFARFPPGGSCQHTKTVLIWPLVTSLSSQLDPPAGNSYVPDPDLTQHSRSLKGLGLRASPWLTGKAAPRPWQGPSPTRHPLAKRNVRGEHLSWGEHLEEVVALPSEHREVKGLSDVAQFSR